jgi:hypothetical protein
MLIPDTKLNIKCPANTKTLKIKRGKRFLFGFSGEYYAYKTSMIDMVSEPGNLTIVVEEDSIQDNIDNTTLGIADYYNNTFTIQIQEDDISIQSTKTQQLHAIVTKNGQVVNLDVEWSSSNPLIATVSSTGLVTGISNGNATITVKLKNNTSITDSINTNVRNVPVNNYEYVMSGNSTLKWLETQTYTAKKLNNGVEIELPYTFTVDKPDLVTLIVIDIKTCKLTGNDKLNTGTVVLTATNNYNPAEKITKQIKIVSY